MQTRITSNIPAILAGIHDECLPRCWRNSARLASKKLSSHLFQWLTTMFSFHPRVRMGLWCFPFQIVRTSWLLKIWWLRSHTPHPAFANTLTCSPAHHMATSPPAPRGSTGARFAMCTPRGFFLKPSLQRRILTLSEFRWCQWFQGNDATSESLKFSKVNWGSEEFFFFETKIQKE